MIAGERILHCGGQLGDGYRPLLRETRQEVLHQKGQVLAPLSERRQRDREDVEPEVEILAEPACRDHLRHVMLRAGDDTHVDRNGPDAADPLHLTVLQRAQQLYLHRQRHVVDIVEEERAAVRHLEASRLVLHRSGERAALVPEQLGLDQRLREQRAADRNEWLPGPRTLVMQEARDDFLPGSALSGDDDIAVALAHDPHEVEHRPHPRAVPGHDVIR